MATKQTLINKFYTESGVQTLKNRYNTLISIYMDENTRYPFEHAMWGFPMLKINSKEELKGRIKELCNILLDDFDMIEIIKMGD